MFTDLSLQVTLGCVPSSQTSHYRKPEWFRQSGQLAKFTNLSLQITIAGAKFTNLSLHITFY